MNALSPLPKLDNDDRTVVPGESSQTSMQATISGASKPPLPLTDMKSKDSDSSIGTFDDDIAAFNQTGRFVY